MNAPTPNTKQNLSKNNNSNQNYDFQKEQETLSLVDNLYANYKKVSADITKELDKFVTFSSSQKQLSQDNISKIAKEYDELVLQQDNQLATLKENVSTKFSNATKKHDKNVATAKDTKQKGVDDLKPRAEEFKAKKQQEEQGFQSSHNQELKKLDDLRKKAVQKRDKALAKEKETLTKAEEKAKSNIAIAEEDYTNMYNKLSTDYDNDVMTLNKQIKNLHTKYFLDIKSINNAYDEKVKALSNEKEALHTAVQQSNSQLEESFQTALKSIDDELQKVSADDKASLATLNKEKKTKTANFNKEVNQANKNLIQSLKPIDKEIALQEKQRQLDLKQLRSDFINQILPLENDLQKRKYSLEVDNFSEQTKKQKSIIDNQLQSAIASLANTTNSSIIGFNYNSSLSKYAHQEAISKEKFGLNKKIVQNDRAVYNRNEEYALLELDLYEERDKKVQQLKLDIAKQERDNTLKIAEINRNYLQVELELDKHFKTLYEKLDKVFMTSSEYYDIWNKRNGVTVDDLKEVNTQINQTLNNKPKGPYKDIYALAIDAYIADIKKAKEGSIKNKVEQSTKNQKALLQLVTACHENNKSANKSIWDKELANQKNKYNNAINNLEQNIADTLSNFETQIQEAKQQLQSDLDNLLATKNAYIEEFNDTESATEKDCELEIAEINKQIESAKNQQEKDQQQLVNNTERQHKELDTALNKKIAEQGKLNIRSDKDTQKAIKFHIKNTEITADTK